MSTLGQAMWSTVRHNTEVGGLPGCLCMLLRVAVADGMKIERTKGYVLDMSVWHRANGVCRVCMAGAVMAVSLGIPRNKGALPSEMGSKVQQHLYAINDMRAGWFDAAYGSLHGKIFPRELRPAAQAARSLVINRFSLSRSRAPWETYLEAANVLEAAGL